MNFAKTRKFYSLLRQRFITLKKVAGHSVESHGFHYYWVLECEQSTQKEPVEVEVISVCPCTHTFVLSHLYVGQICNAKNSLGWCWRAV